MIPFPYFCLWLKLSLSPLSLLPEKKFRSVRMKAILNHFSNNSVKYCTLWLSVFQSLNEPKYFEHRKISRNKLRPMKHFQWHTGHKIAFGFSICLVVSFRRETKFHFSWILLKPSTHRYICPHAHRTTNSIFRQLFQSFWHTTFGKYLTAKSNQILNFQPARSHQFYPKQQSSGWLSIFLILSPVFIPEIDNSDFHDRNSSGSFYERDAERQMCAF